ncbi:MAG: histidine--tRNA ligase [Nitrososphaerales archaeon]
MKFNLPRGLRDIEPADFELMERIRDAFIQTCKLFGFSLMEPSPLEMLETLEAKSGSSIRDEIYAFKDKSGREVGLRFDLTVGLTRWVVSNRALQFPVKIGSFAGLWRYDEPQYGRYRWFYQWDAEIFGPTNVDADAEVIDFAYSLFRRLGLEDISIHIGDRRLVEEYLEKNIGVKDEPLVAEMMRALDKLGKKTAQEILEEYSSKVEPSILNQLLEFGKISGDIEEVLNRLKEYHLTSTTTLIDLVDLLKHRGVKNTVIDLSIVRGLDYYTGVVFEAFTNDQALGALAGGGRYDILPAIFGRPDLGATGVAGGVDRTILALKKEVASTTQREPLIYITYVGKEVRSFAQHIASTLRGEGLPAEVELMERSLRKQLEAASKRNSDYVIIIGPKELASNRLILKNMKDGREEVRSVAETIDLLKQLTKTR